MYWGSSRSKCTGEVLIILTAVAEIYAQLRRTRIAQPDRVEERQTS